MVSLVCRRRMSSGLAVVFQSILLSLLMAPGVAQQERGARPVQQFGHGSLEGVALSADGQTLATGGGGGAFLWDTGTGTMVRAFARLVDAERHEGAVRSLAFSPDGSRIATGASDGSTKIWDASSLTVMKSLVGHTAAVCSMAYSPDGSLILTGSHDGTAMLWEANTGTAVHTIAGHTDDILAVAFSADGTRVVTASSDGTAEVWSAATGVALASFAGHTGAVSCATFSRDGALVISGASDGRAMVWDASTAALVRTLGGHGYAVCSVAVSPDGARVATGDGDGVVRIRYADTWDLWRTIEVAGAGCVDHLCFTPEGDQIFTNSQDHTVTCWDVSSGEAIRVFSGHDRSVSHVGFSPDGRRALMDTSLGTVELYYAGNGGLLKRFSAAGPNAACDAVFSPDGRQVLLTAEAGEARLLDAITGQVARIFPGHTLGPSCLAFSPDGAIVATGSGDGTAKLWSVTSGVLLRNLAGHEGRITDVAFSPDASLVATGSSDQTVRLWETGSGADLGVVARHAHWVGSVSFSPDGARLLTTGSLDTQASIWNVATGELLRSIPLDNTLWVRSAVFSADGGCVYVTRSGGPLGEDVILFHADTGRRLRTYGAHTLGTNAVAVSDDGAYVLTGSSDGTSLLWSATEYHHADVDRNRHIDTGELLRVVQLYRAGAYHCEGESEDGFAPGAEGDASCPRHDADYLEPRWVLDLPELLRVVQLHGSARGYVYCPDAGTDDSFCPMD